MSFTPANAGWAEIPALDIDHGIANYKEVFHHDLARDDSGPNPTTMFSVKDLNTGVAGHLYPGKPAQPGTGSTI